MSRHLPLAFGRWRCVIRRWGEKGREEQEAVFGRKNPPGLLGKGSSHLHSRPSIRQSPTTDTKKTANRYQRNPHIPPWTLRHVRWLVLLSLTVPLTRLLGPAQLHLHSCSCEHPRTLVVSCLSLDGDSQTCSSAATRPCLPSNGPRTNSRPWPDLPAAELLGRGHRAFASLHRRCRAAIISTPERARSVLHVARG